MDCATNILVAVVLLILTFLIYKWFFCGWDYWTSRGIPSEPGALPIVGNTLSVFRLQENFALLCKRIYDSNHGRSMVGFYNMKKPILLLRDPELIKTVMQASFNSFHQNDIALDLDADPLLGRDLFFISGQYWKDLRTPFASTFSMKRMKIMAHVIADTCKILENHLKERTKNKDYLELNAKDLFSRYTTEVAARSCFSIDGNSFTDDYRDTLLESMKLSMDPSMLKALKHNLIFFLPALSRFMKSSFIPVKVDKFFRRVVKDVENVRQKDGVPRHDVLQMTLDLEKGGKYPRVDVLGHLFSFFIESYETSSLTLSFIAYELAKHPKIQDEVRREVETVLEIHKGLMTYEAINELTYLEQVMSETLRLFPPAASLSKVCTEKYQLEGSDGLTLDVEPGTTIIIPVLGIHRDPTIWDKPEEFNPERFRKGSAEERHKFAYIPFGEGPRTCPGMRLGTMQVKAAIATIVSKYRIEVSPKMKEPLRIDPGYFLTTVIGGHWLHLHPLKDR